MASHRGRAVPRVAKGEEFDVALDLSHYVMDGMAVSFLVHKETERDKRVVQYLGEKLKELKEKGERSR